MTTDQESMLSFLKDHGAPEDLVEVVRQETAGFYEIKASGRYPLAKAEKINAAELSRAIEMATGREVAGFEFISISRPFDSPDWMARKVCGRSLGDSVGDSFGGGLWAGLDASLGDRLWAHIGSFLGGGIGASLRDSIESGLWNGFGVYLRACVTASVWDRVGNRFWDDILASVRNGVIVCLGYSIVASLFRYHAAALMGDRERLDRLTPLIRQLRQGVLPLGEKKDDSDVCIVIVD